MLVAMGLSVQCRLSSSRNTAHLRMLAILFAFSSANTISGRSTLQRSGLLMANTTRVVQYVALVAGGSDTAKQMLCGLCEETRISVAEKGVCAKCKRRKELRKICDDEIRNYEEKWKAEYGKILSKEEILEENYESLKKRRENLEGPKVDCEDNLKESCEVLKKSDENSNSGKKRSQNMSNEEYKSELVREWKDNWINKYRNDAIKYAIEASLVICKQLDGGKGTPFYMNDLNVMWNDMERMVKERCCSENEETFKEIRRNILAKYEDLYKMILYGWTTQNRQLNTKLRLFNGLIFAAMCKELDEDTLWEIGECEKDMEEVGKCEMMSEEWKTKDEETKDDLIAICQEMYKMQRKLERKYNELKKGICEQGEKRKEELKKKREEMKMKYERDLKVMRDVKRRDCGELTKKCDELRMELESGERKCEKEMEECDNETKRKFEDLERKRREEDAKLKNEIAKNFLGRLKRTRDEFQKKYEEKVRRCKKEMEKCENEKQKMLRDLKSAKERIQRKYECNSEKGEGSSLLRSLRDAILN